MKRNLLKTLSLTALLGALTIPVASRAQCMCDGGVPATPLKHSFVLDTTNLPTSTISFPKFSPSLGLLACVSFEDTMTLLTRMYGKNDALVPIEYAWLLNVFTAFSGPGISVNQHVSRTYGPDLLTASGSAGDHIYYGPDTLLNNSKHRTSTTNVVPYLTGTGNVSFNFTVNGGGIPTQGGTDYTTQMSSKYWGSFSLTYYWCPNSVLSTNIKNFTAVKNNKNVNLAWIVGNNTTSDIYEIQISKNGREFFGIGRTPANAASAGASAKYTYQYNPDQAPSGQLYFRIRQTSADGKVTYSAVKTLNMDSQAAGNFTAYPNPAFSKVSLQFDAALNGDYKVDVTNQLGQVVISRPVKLKHTNLLDLNLNAVKTPGMYYVRVKDAASGQVYTNKVMINR